MRGGAGYLAIAFALLAFPNSAIAQEDFMAKMSGWFHLVAEDKADEAAAMMTGDATYRYEANDSNLSLPKHVFAEWLAHCRPGLSIPMPPPPGGGATRIFHVDCKKRGSDGSYVGDFTDSINFFVTASASGIRIW